MKKIDIFGDKKFIFDEDKLPSKIVLDCGCEHVLSEKTKRCVVYLQTKRCSNCQELISRQSKIQRKKEEDDILVANRINKIIKKQAIKELKEEGKLPQDYKE